METKIHTIISVCMFGMNTIHSYIRIDYTESESYL